MISQCIETSQLPSGNSKHVNIRAPACSGSMYYNYKKTFSILILAVCDANYRFTLVNIEEVGRRSDSGVYGTSGIGKATEEGKLNFPKPRVIPNYDTEVPLPNVFLADEELAPKPQMLRPYS